MSKYEIILYWSHDDNAFIAEVPELAGCMADGPTTYDMPTINGDGKQSRDFTYIDNVIEANMKACLAPSEAAGQAQL